MSSDNQLNYGLDMDTIDIADSVIIDVATKTLAYDSRYSFFKPSLLR